MKSRLLNILAIMVLLLNGSCYYDKFNELYPGNVVDTCDPGLEVTYNNVVKHIMAQNCLSCHNTSSKKGDIILETYDQVKAIAESGQLLGTIQGESGYKKMPPTTALRTCDIDQIKTWIDAGTPE